MEGNDGLGLLVEALPVEPPQLSPKWFLAPNAYIHHSSTHTYNKKRESFFPVWLGEVWLIEVGLNEDRSIWALRGLYLMKQ